MSRPRAAQFARSKKPFVVTLLLASWLATNLCRTTHADRFPPCEDESRSLPSPVAHRLPTIELPTRLPAVTAQSDPTTRQASKILRHFPAVDSKPEPELAIDSDVVMLGADPAQEVHPARLRRLPALPDSRIAASSSGEFSVLANAPALSPPMNFDDLDSDDIDSPTNTLPDRADSNDRDVWLFAEAPLPVDDVSLRQSELLPPDEVANPFHWAYMQESDSEQSEDDPADRDEPIGPRPPEDINELLVRDTSLLLEPGKIQTEISAIYSRVETPAVVVLPNGAPALERLRNWAFIVPFSIRYGLREDIEIFGTVPLGISYFERDDLISEDSDETGVLGDITTGFVYQLPQYRYWMPDSTLVFRVTAPTSSRSVGSLVGNQATLGNGIWKLGTTYNFVTTYDPVVFFGGVGYTYQFMEERDDFRFQRGHEVDAYYGLGFAVTDDVSLSAQIFASYQTRSSINGFSIPNSDIEPVSLRLGYVRRLTKCTRIQPFVDFGLTPDAADYTVGIRYTVDE